MSRNLKTYRELEEISKSFNLGFYLEYLFHGRDNMPDAYFKLSNHYHPFSLREEETQIIYDIILANSFQSGFEIATAFGISSMAIGQALKETGGRLVSMDAYIEETVNNAKKYDINTRKTFENADGYKMATSLRQALNLENHIEYRVGWSPDDVENIIESSNIPLPLDFAFIDGGHSNAQIVADVSAVLPFLKQDSMILFHDWNNTRKDYVEKIVGLNSLGFDTYKNYNTMFSLWIYKRGNVKLI